MDSPQIEEILKPLCIDDSKLLEICAIFETEMNRGLNKSTNEQASLKMLPTYVRKLPTGEEKGHFLALDLGGTNFRVLLVMLEGSNSPSQMQSKIYAVPQQIMVGSGEQLFDHIANCLAEFVVEHNLKDTKLPLGFTFSFPCRQERLTSARLIHWTKGFKCAGVVGEDVVALLEAAVARKGVKNIQVYAILNDTTGTLMSCAYYSPQCEIGLIVGTGTNACYVERLENVELWNDDRNDPKQVIINCEWGALGDNGELDLAITKYDRHIDENSMNKGQQIFEKMISGMYLGELVRLVLVELVSKGLLFSGNGSEALFERQKFYTKYISEIEEEKPGTYTNMKSVMKELNLEHATEGDYLIVRHVCEIVSQRAAHLVSAGIITLLHKINKPFITIGVDGSVYKFHPHFHDIMTETIKRLVNPELDFVFKLSEDGSGRGAALVAAVAAS